MFAVGEEVIDAVVVALPQPHKTLATRGVVVRFLYPVIICARQVGYKASLGNRMLPDCISIMSTQVSNFQRQAADCPCSCHAATYLSSPRIKLRPSQRSDAHLQATPMP